MPITEGNAAQERLGQEQIGPDLADIVSRLRRAMRRAARAADPALGLSVAQLELLSCMAEHPGIRPSHLARMLRLAPSSVATLLSGLQSAGYVMRTRAVTAPTARVTVVPSAWTCPGRAPPRSPAGTASTRTSSRPRWPPCRSGTGPRCATPPRPCAT